MKVFVAAATRNERAVPHFYEAVDGELVWVVPKVPPCSACGCLVSAVGMASGRTTSRFRVEERADLTRADFVELLANRWHPSRGWAALRQLAEIQLDAAAKLPTGEEFNLREPIDRAIMLSYVGMA